MTTVLLVMVLVLGALLTSAGTSLFGLRVAQQAEGRAGARALAEAALDLAIARLIASRRPPEVDWREDTTWNDGQRELRLTLQAYPGGEALLTLDPERARRLGIPWSLNLLGLPDGRQGWNGTVVAANTAHLVAEGRYSGHVVRQEALLHLPPFPYVIASTLPVEGIGMEVFGVDDPTALDQGFAVPASLRRPGHLASNATDPQPGRAALFLRGGSHVQGDAQARGQVDVASDAVVQGERRPQAEAVPLPTLQLSDFDPIDRPGVVAWTSAGLSGGSPLTGFHRAEVGQGVFTVQDGLRLESGVLFVDGDLQVQGGLSGHGAVIATGKVHVVGQGARLDGANGMAILAGDEVVIQGSSQQRQEFRGLLYTEGALQTRHVNLAGSVVVNKASGSGQVRIEDSTLIQSPEMAQVTIPVPQSVLPPGDLLPTGVTFHANLGGTGAYGFPGNPDDYYTANMNLPEPDYQNPPPGFVITQRPEDDPTRPYFQIAAPTVRPADLIALGSVRANRFVDGEFQRVGADATSRAEAEALLASIDPSIAIAAYLDAAEEDTWQRAIPEYVEMYNTNARLLAEAQPAPPGTPGAVLVPSTVRLDLSRFLNGADAIRILSWREL